MKTLLATTSALAVVAAVPALAADPYEVQYPPPDQKIAVEYFAGNKAAGYVDLYYGFVSFSADDDDLRAAGIAGRANLPFSPTSMFNLQLDGTADTIFESGKGSITFSEATAHLYYRDPSRYAFGAFGSYGVFEGINVWGGGIEGQYYLNRFTLYGQAGLRTFQDEDLNQWYVRGVLRYFPTDNIRLEGELGYASFGFDSSPLNDFCVAATAEYRFDHMPLGIYAQYRGHHYSEDGDTATLNALLFGVRGHLGSDSLFDNDRRGASFDTQRLDLLL